MRFFCCACKTAADAAAAPRNARRERFEVVNSFSFLRHCLADLVQKRGYFLRVALAQRLERHKPTESYLVDDGPDLPEIDRCGLTVYIDRFFDLPRAGVRQELSDLLIRIALAHASHVKNEAEPVRID